MNQDKSQKTSLMLDDHKRIFFLRKYSSTEWENIRLIEKIPIKATRPGRKCNYVSADDRVHRQFTHYLYKCWLAKASIYLSRKNKMCIEKTRSKSIERENETDVSVIHIWGWFFLFFSRLDFRNLVIANPTWFASELCSSALSFIIGIICLGNTNCRSCSWTNTQCKHNSTIFDGKCSKSINENYSTK